jgi:RNA polymerase sigma-70 factor, ECF subfamily
MAKSFTGKRLTVSQKKDFEILVKANMKRAYFSALAILGSHDSAMEVSQDAFLRAYKNFNNYDSSRNFFTWYYKILKNLCLNFIRDNRNKKTERIIDLKNALSISGSDEDFEKAETVQLLNDTLLQLEVEEREIIILKEFEGMTCKQISEMLDMPIGSVMSRLFYSRKKLAEKIKRIL